MTMEKDAIGVEATETPEYETPRITDYGTLAELTAGLGGAKTDVFGNQDGGGGGGGGPGS
jgi:hypothetical protein